MVACVFVSDFEIRIRFHYSCVEFLECANSKVSCSYPNFSRFLVSDICIVVSWTCATILRLLFKYHTEIAL